MPGFRAYVVIQGRVVPDRKIQKTRRWFEGFVSKGCGSRFGFQERCACGDVINIPATIVLIVQELVQKAMPSEDARSEDQL